MGIRTSEIENPPTGGMMPVRNCITTTSAIIRAIRTIRFTFAFFNDYSS
jgi:hypothetical protein